MQLTPRQKKRAEKIAQVINEGNVALARVVIDIDERTEDMVTLLVEQQRELNEKIKNIPTPKDYDDKLEEMREKMEEEDEITVELNII